MGWISIVSESSLSRLGDVAFANRHRLRRMWLISPWITAGDSKCDPLALLIEACSYRRCAVHLLTRPPRELWHSKAIQVLRSNTNPVVLFDPQLHAKLYILECDGFRYAMLGSPNLTRRANTENRELAVEFRTTSTSGSDDVALMIDELLSFARALMCEQNVTLD